MTKTLSASALTLLLLAATGGAAFAQDRDHEHERTQAAPQAQPHPAGPSGGGQRAPGDRFSPQAHGVQGPPSQHFDRGPAPGPGGPPRPFDHDRGPRDGVAPGPARGSDGRGWDGRGGGPVAGQPPHWQPGRYPPVFQSHDRYHIGAYRPPYGYYSRAWRFGDILPGGWFAQPYWIGDFFSYGLPYPPPGYRWVRVGPDALMIDGYTGRIVQVVRGVFW